MLGTWIVVGEITICNLEVKCANCGFTTQRRKSKLHKMHRCPSINNGQKYCYKCQLTKSVDLFHKDSSVYGGFSKTCRECYSERVGVYKYKDRNVHRRDNISDIKVIKNRKIKKQSVEPLELYFKRRTSQLKGRAKFANIPFNLSNGYLMNQYKLQDGRCYYTGVSLYSHVGGITDITISVDKLNPTMGYIESNVVLCLFCMNSFKGQRNEVEFKKFLTDVLPALTAYIIP